MQAQKTQKGFVNKLKSRLEDAKRIDEDPSAFTEQDTVSDIRGMHPAQFQAQNGPIQVPMHQMPVQAYYPQYQAGIMPMNMGYSGPQGKVPSSPLEINQMLLLQQEQMNKAELAYLESRKGQLIHGVDGLNTGYKKTEDFLNKYNSEYSDPQKSISGESRPRTEEAVLMSIEKLDQLLQLKKENKPIPFVQNYTPMRKSKKDATLKATQTLTSMNSTTSKMPATSMNDSLEDTNPLEQVLEQEEEESRSGQFGHSSSQSKKQAAGYLSIKKKSEEQKIGIKDVKGNPQEAKKENKNAEVQGGGKQVVVETEHGTLKVANKKNLNELFS